MARPCQLAAIAVVVLARLSAAEESAAPRARAISPRMAQVLAEAARKMESVAAPIPAASSPEPQTTGTPEVRREELESSNTIVRLPAFIVTERKLPELEEVLTEKELAKVAMGRFLGEETGLNRAMNTLTVKHVWRRIPLLGKFPLMLHETNEERALRLYRAAKEAERWRHVREMQAMTVKPGTGPLKKR